MLYPLQKCNGFFLGSFSTPRKNSWESLESVLCNSSNLIKNKWRWCRRKKSNNAHIHIPSCEGLSYCECWLYVNECLTEPYTWLWPCILPVTASVPLQRRTQTTPAPHQGRTRGRWASPQLWGGGGGGGEEPNTIMLHSLKPCGLVCYCKICAQQVFMISEHTIIIWARKSLCNWFNVAINWKWLMYNYCNYQHFKLPVK